MQVNAEDTAQALRVLHAREFRERAMGAPQMDIEEATGVSETQERREAEAGGIATDRLRSLVGRIERMHEEIKALQGDVTDIYKEAANSGFDAKALKALIRERAARDKNADAVEEQMHLLDLYRRAIGG